MDNNQNNPEFRSFLVETFSKNTLVENGTKRPLTLPEVSGKIAKLDKEALVKLKRKFENKQILRMLDPKFFPFTVQGLRDKGYKVRVRHLRLDVNEFKKTNFINRKRVELAKLIREIHDVLDKGFDSLENIMFSEALPCSHTYMPREEIDKGQISSRGGLTKISITTNDGSEEEVEGLSVCSVEDNYYGRLGVAIALARAIGPFLPAFKEEFDVAVSKEAEEYIEYLCTTGIVLEELEDEDEEEEEEDL